MLLQGFITNREMAILDTSDFQGRLNLNGNPEVE